MGRMGSLAPRPRARVVLGLALLTSLCAGRIRSATTILKRTTGGSAGVSVVSLQVAESMPEVRTVVYLTSSKPFATRASTEWQVWATQTWDLVEGSQNGNTLATRRKKTVQRKGDDSSRTCYFCSFVSAGLLEESLRGTPIDLLVCDESSVHPHAASKIGSKVRLAAHEAFFNARMRLFLRLDGGPRILQPLLDEAVGGASGVDDQCVVSETGSSCFSTGEPMADAKERDELPNGPVARRIGASEDAARLAISAPEQVVSLSAAEARAALQELAPTVQLPIPSSSKLNAPHLTELAVAALYIYWAM